jgi:hypothetical protein
MWISKTWQQWPHAWHANLAQDVLGSQRMALKASAYFLQLRKVLDMFIVFPSITTR